MIADVKKSAEQKMQKSLEALKVDLSKVRSGRAHTGFLDHITVDYYGTPTPINQVANINLIDARTIGVIPWEKKMASVIEKAIRESDLGFFNFSNNSPHHSLINTILALTHQGFTR